MRTILLVARNELLTYLRRPGFLVTTLGLPLVGLVLSLVLGGGPSVGAVAPALLAAGAEPDLPETGRLALVDRSGVVVNVPVFLSDTVQLFPDEQLAEVALRGGAVDALFVVPPDWIASGNVERVTRTFQPFAEDSEVIEFVLATNLLRDLEPLEVLLAREPVREALLEVENVGARAADRAGGEDAGGVAFGLAYGLALLLYTTIFMSSGFLLQSIATEKENRVMEILLTTARPLPMLAGKLLGLGLLGLGQTLIWGGSAYGLARVRFPQLPLDQLGIGWELGALVLLYFVLGYGLYASLMAGLGALVNSVRESGAATTLIVLPAILPLIFLGSLIAEPHSPLAVALSLIPFTAPITMMVRLAQGGIPPWQIVASAALLALSVPLVLLLVARLFRAQTLLASTDFSLRRIVSALRHG